MKYLGIVCILLAGCASPYSGFLGDYSMLKADPKYKASYASMFCSR